MSDLSGVIAPKSDQINADDMITGPMTITISGVKVSPGQEQPVSVSINGTTKVWRPCKTTSRILVAAWGPDTAKFTGRSLTLYRDPKVRWGGVEVGGIRISHMSHIARDFTMMLTESKQKRAPATIKVLVPAEVPTTTETPADIAKAKAAEGTKAFTAWWNGDQGKALRGDVRDLIPELQAICANADAVAADPFGLPPIDDAALARAEAEAKAAADEAARSAVDGAK